jgi:DNA gyrase subunit A
VLLSSSGLLARATDDGPVATAGPRGKHDVVVSSVPATVRGEVGAVTSAGRMLRLPVLDLPALPATAGPPTLAGGAPLSEFLDLGKDETVVALAPLDGERPGLALGTARGVVKRVAPDYPSNKSDFEVVRLDDGDRVVGAVELVTGDEDLVFVTDDAQQLRFPASAVRPQGRAAGGMAGVRVTAGRSALWFGAVDGSADNVVVTVAGTAGALPGTQAGSAKVTPYALYPAKGRATGGVRCQRFVRGEDTLLLAWVGPAPGRAATAAGVPVDLPAPDPRRDGSGTPLPQPVAAVSG